MPSTPNAPPKSVKRPAVAVACPRCGRTVQFRTLARHCERHPPGVDWRAVELEIGCNVRAGRPVVRKHSKSHPLELRTNIAQLIAERDAGSVGQVVQCGLP